MAARGTLALLCGNVTIYCQIPESQQNSQQPNDRKSVSSVFAVVRLSLGGEGLFRCDSVESLPW
eukprot:940923-Amphidinium_carterae.1